MAGVAQQLAYSLKELGIKYIFGVPSGNLVDYMEAIREVDGLEFILVTNEASAGFMADVCWRLSGQIAACFGTFGPGACNLSAGVCGGYLDRSPMLVFTDEMDDKMRPRITQMNIDHQKLFEPITKWTTRLEINKVKETIYKAFQIAISEVPGPVHIGLPAGIGIHETNDETLKFESPIGIPNANVSVLEEMKIVFAKARKPIIALGITSMRAGVRDLIIEILDKFKIPVVLTPMAKGMVSENHSSYAGVLAHALGNIVGETHQQADLVIGIGYDPIEINYEDWIPNVSLIHIDTIPADLDTKNYNLACDVVGDLRHSLEFLFSIDSLQNEWDFDELAERRENMFSQLAAKEDGFGPRKVLQLLREKLADDGIMTCDVGAHLHLIGQQWKTPSPDCQLMTNGCSSMGFAMPAAIAAKLCMPDREVCCIVGDGGFAMMAGEILTARRLNLNIVFVVLKDDELALIRIKQDNKSNETYGVILDPDQTNSKSSDHMFGAQVHSAMDSLQFKIALEKAFNENGPIIVEAIIDSKDYDELVLKGNK